MLCCPGGQPCPRDPGPILGFAPTAEGLDGYQPDRPAGWVKRRFVPGAAGLGGFGAVCYGGMPGFAAPECARRFAALFVLGAPVTGRLVPLLDEPRGYLALRAPD